MDKLCVIRSEFVDVDCIVLHPDDAISGALYSRDVAKLVTTSNKVAYLTVNRPNDDDDDDDDDDDEDKGEENKHSPSKGQAWISPTTFDQLCDEGSDSQVTIKSLSAIELEQAKKIVISMLDCNNSNEKKQSCNLCCDYFGISASKRLQIGAAIGKEATDVALKAEQSGIPMGQQTAEFWQKYHDQYQCVWRSCWKGQVLQLSDEVRVKIETIYLDEIEEDEEIAIDAAIVGPETNIKINE